MLFFICKFEKETNCFDSGVMCVWRRAIFEMCYSEFITALCLVAVTVKADESYCDPSICPDGAQPHVACGADLVC